MRAWLAAAAAILAIGIVGAPAASASTTDPQQGYGCTPPVPSSAANCALWHNVPVTLIWGWDKPNGWTPVSLPGNDCISSDTHVFDSDTPPAGTTVECYVWRGSGTVFNKDATVFVDRTPPTVNAMSATRPADHDGWWNQPVALVFGGTDATSGIATCDTVTYSGPDSAAAQVTGTCTDVAGNVAAGTFPIKYDATPPSVTPGSSDTKAGSITINWTPSADTASSQVLRSPGIGGAPVSEVYSGPGKSFTDSGVTSGATYTYTINASDAAGNVASTTMQVKAKAVPQAAPAGVNGTRMLDWRRVKGADYYNVQVFRNGRKILSAWPRFSQLRLQKHWKFRGVRRSLSAGIYRWYVWPGFGARSAHRYGKLITQKRFKITAPTSGRAASRG